MKAKRIGIFTGRAWEKWNLDSYKDYGIGGSETCAGRLAQTAAEKGHNVTIYGEFDSQIQHGVELIHWENFYPENEYYDLFIASRDIGCLDKKVKAGKILAWIHDIGLITEHPLGNHYKSIIDKFIVLSPWHKQFVKDYYELSDNKLEIIPNGINVEFFNSSDLHLKEFGKLIWTSSPDRGLDNLLYFLPWIKDKVPEVHIEIYYGFHNWLSHVVKSKDIKTLERIERLKAHIASCDYIQMQGRVGQKDLAKSWMKTYLWVYPTQFQETYCISAMEAQASGTPIICSKVGALQTTVGEHGYLVNQSAYTREGRKEFVNKAIEVLKNKDLWLEMSAKSLEGAKNVSWNDRWNDYWKKWID